MQLRDIGEAVLADYGDEVLEERPVRLIIENTENTWQPDRGAAEITDNTSQGKLAEKIVAEYMESCFGDEINVLSYDEIRNDGFEKTAPFDFLFWEKGGSGIETVIAAIQADIQCSPRYVRLRGYTRELCRRLRVKIVEIKSTQIRQKQMQEAGFSGNYYDMDSVSRLAEEIKCSDDFLTYPHYCRKTEKPDFGMTDYFEIAQKYDSSLWWFGGEELARRVIRSEVNYQSDVFIRVYLDQYARKGLVIGWLDRERFIDDSVVIKKMPKKGKSEKAVYFAKSLTYARAMEDIRDIFTDPGKIV